MEIQESFSWGFMVSRLEGSDAESRVRPSVLKSLFFDIVEPHGVYCTFIHLSDVEWENDNLQS